MTAHSNVKFDETTHTYTLDGYVLPSVNQVLKSVATRKTDDDYWKSISGVEFITNPSYAEFGKKFHALIAAIEKGYKVTYNDEIAPYVKSYEMFYEMYPELKGGNLIEKPYGYLGHVSFAGTPDKIAYNSKNYGYVVIDWKTGKSKQKTWELQLAAYAKLYSLCYLNGNIEHAKAYSVRIRDGKKPLVCEYSSEQLIKEWDVFESMLKVYLYANPIKKEKKDAKI